MSGGVKVLVMVDGVYAEPGQKTSITAKRGDLIEIHGAWYAAKMIDQGLVFLPPDDMSSLPRIDTVSQEAETEDDDDEEEDEEEEEGPKPEPVKRGPGRPRRT